MVVEAAGEERCRFHIHGHGPRFAQVLLELLVVLPHAAVGGVDRARPVVVTVVAQGGGHGTLQHEGRQRGHLGREVVVRRTLAANTCQRQDIVAQLRLAGNAAALAEEEAGGRLNGAKQVHDERGVGAAHAEVDHRDALGRDGAHVCAETNRLNARLLAEHIHVVVEIREQNVLAKLLKRHLGVAHEPIARYFLFCFHILLNLQSESFRHYLP